MKTRAIIIMGPSGTGKSTIGAALARRLHWLFVEGDELHSSENVDAMARGLPLTDAQRRPWLDRIAVLIEDRLREGQNLVVACSALARRYREILARPRESVLFVDLMVPRDVLLARVAARTGHFMPASMVDSQLAAYQPFEAGENGFTVDATRTPAAVIEKILAELGA